MDTELLMLFNNIGEDGPQRSVDYFVASERRRPLFRLQWILSILIWLISVAALSPTVVVAASCDCTGTSQSRPELRDVGSNMVLGQTGYTLEDLLSPEELQVYVAHNLQRIAVDMASMTKAQGCTGEDSRKSSGPRGYSPHRRVRRFTNARSRVVDDKVSKLNHGDDVPDVPVVVGLAGLRPRSLHTTSSPLVTSFNTPVQNARDPPVFKGSSEGTQIRALGGSTTPAVPVVKGYSDPAHPSIKGIQLTPDEQEALSVLLGRRAGGRASNPPSSVSGKVGTGEQQQNNNCCSQKRLLQELDRQLAILGRLNEQRRQQEWARSGSGPGGGQGYPSPYHPYLHNLPIQRAYGMDAPLGSWSWGAPPPVQLTWTPTQQFISRHLPDNVRHEEDSATSCPDSTPSSVDGKIDLEQKRSNQRDDYRTTNAKLRVDSKLGDAINPDM